MNATPPTAYRFQPFLPSQLSHLLAIFPLLHSDLRAVPPADDSLAYRFRLFLPSTPLPPLALLHAFGSSRHPSLRCSATARASSADFHPRLPLSAFLPSPPSVRAINAIPPAAYRFRLFPRYPRHLSGLSMLSSLCIPLSALLAIQATDFCFAVGFSCPQRHPSEPSTQFLPLLTAFGSSRHYRRHLSGLSLLSLPLLTAFGLNCSQRHLSGLRIPTLALPTVFGPSCRHSFRIFLPSSLCCTRLSERFHRR
jgi:hypothetical protein